MHFKNSINNFDEGGLSGESVGAARTVQDVQFLNKVRNPNINSKLQ